jgi:uncharacterized OsmC-like protein
MDAAQLRGMQAPLKARYKDDPKTALLTLHAHGRVDGEAISFHVETGKAKVEAGLHPASGGDGSAACSGDMMLEALASCAGVTLKAVATAMSIPLRRATVRAEGDLDFRGTLGVSKEVPVGFSAIRLVFDVDSDAPKEQLEKLVQLTERYCVVFQTLAKPPAVAVELKAPGSSAT